MSLQRSKSLACKGHHKPAEGRSPLVCKGHHGFVEVSLQEPLKITMNNAIGHHENVEVSHRKHAKVTISLQRSS